MLKMKIDGAKTIEITVAGTIPDIVAELLLGVKTIKKEINDSTGMGDAFVETIKKGLEFMDELEDELDSDGAIDKAVDEIVDKALEDDKFLEKTMDMLPDELKADFARRLKERARKGQTEEKEAEEK